MSLSLSFAGAAPALLGLIVAGTAWAYAKHTRHRLALYRAQLATGETPADPVTPVPVMAVTAPVVQAGEEHSDIQAFEFEPIPEGQADLGGATYRVLKYKAGTDFGELIVSPPSVPSDNFHSELSPEFFARIDTVIGGSAPSGKSSGTVIWAEGDTKTTRTPRAVKPSKAR